MVALHQIDFAYELKLNRSDRLRARKHYNLGLAMKSKQRATGLACLPLSARCGIGSLFANAKPTEDAIQNVIGVDGSYDAAKLCQALAQFGGY